MRRFRSLAIGAALASILFVNTASAGIFHHRRECCCQPQCPGGPGPGVGPSPVVQAEIDNLQNQINGLQQQINQLKAAQPAPPSTPPTAPQK